jgi:RNA polymerase sigma factor (sigma-70 family)
MPLILPPIPDDTQLLHTFVTTRSPEAFRHLVDRHLPAIHTAAARILRQYSLAHHADDIVQSVFLLLAQNAGRIPANTPLVGWLYQVTHYACANLQKTERRRRQRETAAMRPTRSVPPTVSDAQALLDPALLTLSPNKRNALLLRYTQNLPITEIARLTHVPPATAKKRLRQALQKLRHYFAAHGMLAAAPLALQALAPAPSTAFNALASAVTAAALAPAAATTASATSLFVAKGVALMIHVSSTVKTTLAVILVIILLLAGYFTATWMNAPSASPVPSATAAISTPLAAEPLRGVFPRGGQVEVVAVNSSVDPKVWWSPDGSPLAQKLAGADFTALRDPWGEPRITYQFALRVADLPPDAGPLYLDVKGAPRVAPLVPLQKDPRDPTLYYGAALLYADQPLVRRLTVTYSSQRWQHLVLDSTGIAVPAIPKIANWYTYFGPPIRDLNPAFEKDGKTFLVINGEPWGDLEYQATAMARNGASKPARDTFLGPVIGINRLEKYATALFSAWAFDMPLREVERYEVAVRRVDQRVSFQDVALHTGQHTPAANLLQNSATSIPYDSAFSNRFYSIGDRLMDHDAPAAAKICAEVLQQARARRAQLQAVGSPDLYAVDHGLPILAKLNDALHNNDVPTAASLVESSTGSGIQLLNAIQALALYTTAPEEK